MLLLNKIIATIFISLLILPQAALAEGHSAAARMLTLARLEKSVNEACDKSASASCVKLQILVKQLYVDPKVATASDLAILSEMAKLGQEVAKSRSDLATAIEHTQKIWNHVVKDHEGKWELTS